MRSINRYLLKTINLLVILAMLMPAAPALAAGASANIIATETLLTVTGGNPADEIQSATQAIQETFPSVAQSLGQTGETPARIVKNTTHIESISKTASYRIP